MRVSGLPALSLSNVQIIAFFHRQFPPRVNDHGRLTFCLSRDPKTVV